MFIKSVVAEKGTVVCVFPCDIQRHFIPGETHSIYWKRSCVIRRCRIRRWSGRSIVFREKQKRPGFASVSTA